MKTPRAIGAQFAQTQANADGKLMKQLQAIVSEYTVDQVAEFTECLEGYGEQAKQAFNPNTAKVRKSEFKTVLDQAIDHEKRTRLFNIIDNYQSVQTLVKDIRMLEKGTAFVDDEGKVEKFKTGKTKTEPENEVNDTLTLDDKTNPGDVIDILEGIMQWAHGKGYAKASDLLLQAMSAIGTKE
jgi:hypothetical protein